MLKISARTLLKKILLIAKNIKQPMITIGKEYEVDELCTYVGDENRRIWLVCALEKQSRNIVSFNVVTRTKQTLRKVTENLNLSQAKKDLYGQTPSCRRFIEKKVHKVSLYGINHLEKLHITLRAHLKRLNRKNICFSRSLIILNAILKIYFWGITYN